MKNIFITLLFILLPNLCKAQNFTLNIFGKNQNETKILDNLQYKKKHTNIKSILQTVKSVDSLLILDGYFEKKTTHHNKENDTIFNFFYNLNQKKDSLVILTKKFKNLLNEKSDSIIIPINETKKWINDKLNLLEKNGQVLAKIQLTNFKTNSNKIYANISISNTQNRIINDITILGYKNYPKNFKKAIQKKFIGKNPNSETTDKIYNLFNQKKISNQIKYPEILFTIDSTKIYVYLEKKTNNKFEGYLGANTNNQNKTILTGYIDLYLNNTINTGESISLKWNNDGNKQTSLKLSLETPYIFNSSISTKQSLKIFKQDTLFQNTKTEINLGKNFNFNQTLYIGVEQTKSTNTQQSNPLIENFKSTFYNLSYFTNTKQNFYMIMLGFGKRKTENNHNNQIKGEISLSYNYNLNQKNTLHVTHNTLLLFSKTYLPNEQFRIGGSETIRGFRENSLQGNNFIGIKTEYRYNINPNFTLHTVTDFGYLEDKTTFLKTNLYSIGLGLKLASNNNQLNLTYSNGFTQKQSFKSSNFIFNINFNSRF